MKNRQEIFLSHREYVERVLQTALRVFEHGDMAMFLALLRSQMEYAQAVDQEARALEEAPI